MNKDKHNLYKITAHTDSTVKELVRSFGYVLRNLDGKTFYKGMESDGLFHNGDMLQEKAERVFREIVDLQHDLDDLLRMFLGTYGHEDETLYTVPMDGNIRRVK